MDLAIDELESPLGTVWIVAAGERLCAVDFGGCEDRMNDLLRRRYGDATLRPARDPGGFTGRIRAYLDGDAGAVDAIEVDPGGTRFQRRVWDALRAIPAGQTRTYGDLAAALGRPTASRAVGMANSRNPVAIVIPCHRVIGASGALTGYAGGIERKRWLLAHEGAL